MTTSPKVIIIIIMNRRRTALLTSLAAALTFSTAACSSSDGTGQTAPTSRPGPSVLASFYPIEYLVERIGGDRVTVSSLTKPGAEPHDLEIAGQQLADMQKARIVAYTKGFQPAVDSAIGQVPPDHVLDLTSAAHLMPADEEHQHEGEEAGHDHDHGDMDPHFWLDPERYADVAKAVGARLAEVDPDGAATYAKNTDAVVAELGALDKEFAAGLTSCKQKDLVVSHAAFGYLANRYGFHQVGISGISPDAEPSAAALQKISTLVKDKNVTTIYQETLVEPHFAKTVAGSTGAKLVTLDPLEGITDESAGKDYFSVMRANLAALKQGQQCS